MASRLHLDLLVGDAAPCRPSGGSMQRIISTIGLVALAAGLGGCVVAAPVDDYSYYEPAYERPGVVVAPPVVVSPPYVERHYDVEHHTYVVDEDRVVRPPAHRFERRNDRA